MPSPLVSIISINYKQAAVTEAMLLSLEKISYPNYEVWLVDNASQTAAELKALMQKFPKVHFVESETNLGFAGGNNLAIKQAKGEFILLLNNDTEVHPNFLGPLVQTALSHPNAGMLSPKIKYFEQLHRVQYAGGTTIHPYTGRGGASLSKGKEDTPLLTKITQTAMTHGAAMLVSRKVLEQVGLMEESFFLYYEELDWCERAKKAGFELFYVGTSEVLHKESMSVGKHSPLKTYYMTRNRIWLMRRNFGGFSFLVFLLYFLGLAFPKNMLSFFLKKEWKQLNAFWKGAWDGIFTKT